MQLKINIGSEYATFQETQCMLKAIFFFQRHFVICSFFFFYSWKHPTRRVFPSSGKLLHFSFLSLHVFINFSLARIQVTQSVCRHQPGHPISMPGHSIQSVCRYQPGARWVSHKSSAIYIRWWTKCDLWFPYKPASNNWLILIIITRF